MTERNFEAVKADAMRRLVAGGKNNAAEREYALACDRLRVQHNEKQEWHQWNLKAKYRG